MRPTSAAPTPRRSGFTLIECLLALAIASIALGVASISLITCLKAEAKADDRRKACLATRTAHTSLFMREDVTAAVERVSQKWKIEMTLREKDKSDERRVWERWVVTDADQPDLAIMLGRQTEAAGP